MRLAWYTFVCRWVWSESATAGSVVPTRGEEDCSSRHQGCNILVTYGNGGTMHVKIADFGLAKKLPDKPGYFTTRLRTPQYLAPELLLKVAAYNHRVDVWSFGVLVYTLETADFPFPTQPDDDDYSKSFNLIKNKKMQPMENPKKYGPHPLIQGLLNTSAEHRFSASDALGCAWMKCTSDDDAGKTALPSKGIDNMLSASNDFAWYDYTSGQDTLSAKVFSKASDFEAELNVLRLLSGGIGIIKLAGVLDTRMGFVVERLSGGFLSHSIHEGSIGSDDVRKILSCVLKAVEHCHNRRVALCNLCPETLLLHRGTDVTVKIVDLSSAKLVPCPNGLTTSCNLHLCNALEVQVEEPAYDVECDMWSVGVCLYLLLGGSKQDAEEMANDLEFWGALALDASDLLASMLYESNPPHYSD
ncbi:hypothetical protein MPSEU_000153100 [Mayamaea pseudoterrestris]|nr:hypothetical protein MPSEU_000153100 [Mayamaea pseudoterrestris]